MFSAFKVLATARSVEHIMPTPWDRARFMESVAQLRGRPIVLSAMDADLLDGSPCGLWLSFADHDEIVYHAETSAYHVDQTVLHEVGHMLLGHGGSPSTDTSLRSLLPDIDFEALQSVLKRSNFDDDQEGEAETFADLLMSAMMSRHRRSAAMDDFMGLM